LYLDKEKKYNSGVYIVIVRHISKAVEIIHSVKIISKAARNSIIFSNIYFNLGDTGEHRIRYNFALIL